VSTRRRCLRAERCTACGQDRKRPGSIARRSLCGSTASTAGMLRERPRSSGRAAPAASSSVRARPPVCRALARPTMYQYAAVRLDNYFLAAEHTFAAVRRLSQPARRRRRVLPPTTTKNQRVKMGKLKTFKLYISGTGAPRDKIPRAFASHDQGPADCRKKIKIRIQGKKMFRLSFEISQSIFLTPYLGNGARYPHAVNGVREDPRPSPDFGSGTGGDFSSEHWKEAGARGEIQIFGNFEPPWPRNGAR
jgi:hypothetical protein